MLEKEIEKLGLSDKEARVYLAALQLGKSPVQEIAVQARVNRATTYVIIDSLRKKGLMSTTEQNEKILFVAESPSNLLGMVRLQEKELKEKEKKIADLLPELLALHSLTGNKPKVKFYEGIEGLYTIQEEYLKTKSKQIYNISCFDNFLIAMPRVGNEYTPRRIKKGIRSKLIYITKDGPNKRFSSNEEELRESKYISPEVFPFKSDITIFDNKVSIESYEEGIISVLIEHQSIADSLRAIFEFIWNNAGKEV
ncbi:MAG TPA: helix-turn-helix domain-containing protein [Patescibacteria group bacterium]|nr:helix-turn-helix domain-containing protein [Patescibacteria group bacterium]